MLVGLPPRRIPLKPIYTLAELHDYQDISLGFLEKLGFLRGCIVETIVTTLDRTGKPNAAPMGAFTEDMENLILRPYTDTLTYRNLDASRSAVVNLTLNPEVFYRTAFKDANSRLPSSWFEDAETVNAPRLKGAYAFIEVSVLEISHGGGERAEAKCAPRLVRSVGQPSPAYCRAIFATLESIIHATRVRTFLSEGRREEAAELMKLVEHYRSLVQRVAPNSPYERTMESLARKIESWRRSINESKG